jgi:Fic-DOC domain mobile mystery protein B
VIDPFAEPEDATPLAPSERRGLRQSWITTRADLNEAEQLNIVRAVAWATARRSQKLLTEPYLRSLHRRMFLDVWEWAGDYRTTERNIGIEAFRIATATRELLDDVTYWLNKAAFEPDEAAVRFHHRLVAIHPFPNGNGRHARLMADLLIRALGSTPFPWGRSNLSAATDTRARYIAALRAADNHDIRPLLAFARS